MVNVQNITDENSLARLIGLNQEDNSISSRERINLMGFATIADHEQLISMFPMRLSDIAEKLGLPYWYYVDKAIKQIQIDTGFNLKDSNNIYHVDIGIKQPLHRYSVEALELLKKVINNEAYNVIVDDAGVEVCVTRE